MLRNEVRDALIGLMNAFGVEFSFYNPGFELVPMIERLEEYRKSGIAAPRPILCPDESVTVAAAHGNWMVSGKPQFVMVHSELGSLQIGGALHQAQWGRVPLVIFSGVRGPAPRTNWLNEPVDQGSMLRNFVKWDHQVRPGENLVEIVEKGFNIAVAEPTGPVYICFPQRDMLFDEDSCQPRPRQVFALPPPDPGAVAEAADILLSSRDPLIMAGHSGRNKESAAALTALAEVLGARVVTSPIRMNFPCDHPLCAFLEPNDGVSVVNPYLPAADTILAIDYDLPYAAPRVAPRTDAKFIHVDVDMVKQGIPLWNRQPQVAIRADSAKVIPALSEAVREKQTAEQRAKAMEQVKRLTAEHRKIHEDWQETARSAAKERPISPEWLCYCLNQQIDDDTIIVNQSISPSISVARQIGRSRPGTLAACSGGSIGWSLPAALGVKLAAPNQTVVSFMGDGAFIYGCPVATLWSSVNHQAPFLSVIFNNQAYGAIKQLFKATNEKCGADILPPPDYGKIAEGCGAYGRTLSEPEDTEKAIGDCLEQVTKGTPSVLDVKIKNARSGVR